jgi:hypothetical protein
MMDDLLTIICTQSKLPPSVNTIIQQTQEVLPDPGREKRWHDAGFIFDLRTIKRIKQVIDNATTSGGSKRKGKRR